MAELENTEVIEEEVDTPEKADFFHRRNGKFFI